MEGTSKPSALPLTDEQRKRMDRNLKLAQERRAKKRRYQDATIVLTQEQKDRAEENRKRALDIQRRFQVQQPQTKQQQQEPVCHQSTSDHQQVVNKRQLDEIGRPSQDHIPPKKKKRVTFPEVEFEIRTFERDDITTLDADGPITNSGNADYDCPTEQITLLSEQHGRARRKLRDISKHDLRTTMKYGKKTRAHDCLRTGRPRYKFQFANVVYITDETCRREITCYKDPVDIQKCPVTEPMRREHGALRKILREEPHLCVSNAYIIIDQSGSMKTSDVNGFRNRSQAAYGSLALDFISEQLHGRPRNERVVESVTMIEMKEIGEVFLEKEPLDWILFNKIIDRQKQAIPKSHGNYRESLRLAKQLMLAEIQLLRRAEIDFEEFPNFMLLFLSDGKPSDNDPVDSLAQHQIITELSETLGAKLTFYAMGVGKSRGNFTALQELVRTSERCGAQGQFVHAGLSSAVLSSTFGDISRTMTETRTELLGIEKVNKVQKEYTLQEKGSSVGKDIDVFRCYIKENHIKRCAFNKARYELNPEMPWEEIPFKNSCTEDVTGFEMETWPFGAGAERIAYRFHEIANDGQNGSHKRVGKMMVAKESKYESDEHDFDEKIRARFHVDFCLVQMKAKELAVEFNREVSKCATLKPAEEGNAPSPPLEFLDCHVYAHNSGKCDGLLVESFLKGRFTKYNCNNGHVRKYQGRMINLVAGAVDVEEFPQAFSHWVYIHTDHNMIVCDIQGVYNEEGRFPKFELTDPAICTKKKPRYGNTDLGVKGIRNFVSTHKCGKVCKALGLPLISSADS